MNEIDKIINTYQIECKIPFLRSYAIIYANDNQLRSMIFKRKIILLPMSFRKDLFTHSNFILAHVFIFKFQDKKFKKCMKDYIKVVNEDKNQWKIKFYKDTCDMFNGTINMIADERRSKTDGKTSTECF